LENKRERSTRKVEFRRSGAPQQRGMGGRAIVLTIGFVLMGGFILFMIGDIFPKEVEPTIVDIHYINKNRLTIDGNTTKYEEYASSLVEHIRIVKQQAKKIDIHLHLPPTVTAGETADIIFLTKTVESKQVNVLLKTQ